MISRRSIALPLFIVLALFGCGGSPDAPGPEGGRDAGALDSMDAPDEASLAPLERPHVEGPDDEEAGRTAAAEGGPRITVMAHLGEGLESPAFTERGEVWLLDRDVIDRKAMGALRKELGSKDAWEAVTRFGVRAGELVALDGEEWSASIPMPSRRTEVVVRVGRRMGRRMLRHEEGGELLVMLSRIALETVEMTVVDAAGDPVAGVPTRPAASEASLRYDGNGWRDARLSDERGAVRFLDRPLLDLLVLDVLGACVEVPVVNGGKAELPPFGAVEVRIGEPRPEGELSLEAIDAEGNGLRIIEVTGHEVVRFDRVALGRSLELRAKLATGDARVTLDGPTRMGQVVQVALELTPYREVRAALVDSSGEPMVGWNVTVDVPGVGVLESDRTGAAGDMVARFSRARGGPEPGGMIELHARRRVGGPRPTQRFQGPFARVPLGAAPGSGDLDLGRVTMGPLPLLVAGQVLGKDGNPMRRAIVRLERSRAQDRGAAAGRIRRPAGFEMPHETRTDKDGRFEFRSILDETFGGALELSLVAAEFKGAVSPRVPFEPGQDGVILRIPRCGNLLLDVGDGVRGGHMTNVHAELRQTDGEARRIVEVLDGPAYVRDLPAGTYEFVLSVQGREAVRVGGIVVRPDETTRDGRLLPVGLGAEIRMRWAQFHRPGGAPVERVDLWQRKEGVWSKDSLFTLLGNGAWAVVGEGVDRVMASAGGAPVELGVSDGKTRVALPKPQEVTLRLGHPGAALAFAARRTDKDLPPAVVQGLQADRDGVVHASLPGPGTYVLEPESSSSHWSGVTFRLQTETRSVTIESP